MVLPGDDFSTNLKFRTNLLSRDRKFYLPDEVGVLGCDAM
jgi:hypothetical protein